MSTPERKCGTCRYFQEADKPPENLVLRAKYRVAHPEATCQGDGKPRDSDDKPCLIWMERKAKGGVKA